MDRNKSARQKLKLK